MIQLIILSHWVLFIIIIGRLNVTADAARPNPQGSLHYGNIKIVRTILLANSEASINGKLTYALNGISNLTSRHAIEDC